MAPELGETFMPVTILLGGGLDRHSLRSTFTATPEAAAATVLRPPSTLPLGRDGDHWLPWEVNDFQQFIRDVAARKSTSPSPMIEFADFFHSIFGRAPPRVLQVAQGAQFAASRAALQRVPLVTLRRLLELVEAGHAELPYYMEMVWLYLLQPEALDSTLDGTVPPIDSPLGRTAPSSDTPLRWSVALTMRSWKWLSSTTRSSRPSSSSSLKPCVTLLASLKPCVTLPAVDAGSFNVWFNIERLDSGTVPSGTASSRELSSANRFRGLGLPCDARGSSSAS